MNGSVKGRFGFGAAALLAGLLAGCATGPSVPESRLPASAGSPAAPDVPPASGSVPASLVAAAEDVAGRIPSQPHGRDRAMMLEEAVKGWIALGDLARAEAGMRRIGDWRRGEATALVAQARAARGELEAARRLAAEARELGAREEDWRRDRIGAEVARTLAMTDDLGQIDGLVDPMAAAEAGNVAAAVTAVVPADRLEAQATVFDKAIGTGAFDLVRGGLDGYLAIMRRSDCDDAWRARAVAALDGALPGLPYDLRVQYLVTLADVLGAQGRVDEARAALGRADREMAAAAFLPEDIVPIGAPIAVARGRIGDPDAARAALRSLRSTFEARREEVVDLRRATSWRALASAFMGLGDRADAEACFAAALEDGALNPNARPRAEDLCRTLLAMARCGFAPTDGMDRRIDAIRAGLVDPW
jgi:tetratricopeptide (TPR) repeat protein